MIDRDRVREALTGPIASVHTPFNEDGSIDFDGLRRSIDFDIAAGSRTVLLTAGDSHYTAHQALGCADGFEHRLQLALLLSHQ